jgi:hypothetical protein
MRPNPPLEKVEPNRQPLGKDVSNVLRHFFEKWQGGNELTK